MAIYALLIAETKIKLWGLSARERLRRMLTRAGVAEVVDDLGQVPADASVLVIRTDYLYDNRVLNGLLEAADVMLLTSDRSLAVAAHVASTKAAEIRDYLSGKAGAAIPSGVEAATPDAISRGFETKLRRLGEAFVVPITSTNQATLERQLFDASYKGITDLVTKWAWPTPARWVTHLCARFGIRPNHVTSLSWVLAIVTAYLFAQGQLGWGLTVGWVMTFLDTVDGKLARVTVTYTHFGNLFDHILDILHPPFWYLAWAFGMTHYGVDTLGFSFTATIWLVFGGYVVGRIAEGLFRHKLSDFSIFAWQPIDSYSRLVTARRNPSLIMMTVGLVAGRPDAGLFAVVLWTLLSTLFLLVRVAYAWYVKTTAGELRPWRLSTDSEDQQTSLAYRWFAR